MVSWTHLTQHLKLHLGRFSRFCTAQCTAFIYTLQWAAPFFSKLPIRMGDLDPIYCNTWFPGRTQIHTPNSMSIGSAIFAGTDKPRYSVCYNRPHLLVHSTAAAMQPNNNYTVGHKKGANLFFSVTLSTRPASADRTARAANFRRDLEAT